MSESESCEAVRRFLRAIETDDLIPWVREEEVDLEARTRAAPFLDPEFEVIDSATLSGLGVRPRGRGWDFLRGNYRELLSAFESYRERVDELRDVGGGRVLALGEARGRPVGGGPEVVQLGGVIYTVRDGRIVRIEYFLDRAEAIAAAGAA
ncbi:MAG: nuclear transport factor 2 family protein [Solirubrobacterales bacterium]